MKKIVILILTCILCSGLFAEKIHEFTPVPFGSDVNTAVHIFKDLNFILKGYDDESYTVINTTKEETVKFHSITFYVDKNKLINMVAHKIIPEENYQTIKYLDTYVNTCIKRYGLRLINYESTDTGVSFLFEDAYNNKTFIEINHFTYEIIMIIDPSN